VSFVSFRCSSPPHNRTLPNCQPFERLFLLHASWTFFPSNVLLFFSPSPRFKGFFFFLWPCTFSEDSLTYRLFLDPPPSKSIPPPFPWKPVPFPILVPRSTLLIVFFVQAPLFRSFLLIFFSAFPEKEDFFRLPLSSFFQVSFP